MAYESKTLKPVTAAICMALATGLGASASAMADSNPFSVADLDAGYQLAGDKHKEGKCGEGKCGEKHEKHEKHAEGKCGEGKCGGDKAAAEGACGEKHKNHAEGKCGEGKCGGDKAKEKGKEGACGGQS